MFASLIIGLLSNKSRFSQIETSIPVFNDWYAPNQKISHFGEFFIGDNNATNLELLLSEEYYTETMQTYKLAKAFLEKHPSFQERLFN